MRPRILPADVYDTLEFSALAFGGIGKDEYFDYGYGDNAHAPRCAYGHAMFAHPVAVPPWGDSSPNALSDALGNAGIDSIDNDDAVGRAERISFRQWCRRLNVVRGVA